MENESHLIREKRVSKIRKCIFMWDGLKRKECIFLWTEGVYINVKSNFFYIYLTCLSKHATICATKAALKLKQKYPSSCLHLTFKVEVESVYSSCMDLEKLVLN